MRLHLCTPPRMELDMPSVPSVGADDHRALIIVDVQNDFTEGARSK